MVNYTYRLPSETGHNLTQGADKFFAWIAYVQPEFINYFIIMVWSIIFIGGVFTEKKLTSRAEYMKWGFIASFITFGFTIILTFMSELNATYPLVILGVVMIVFGLIWFNAKEVWSA